LLLASRILDQLLRGTHLFVRYAATLPEVGAGGVAVPVVKSVVGVWVDTGVAVELAAIVVIIDVENAVVELRIMEFVAVEVGIVEPGIVELIIGGIAAEVCELVAEDGCEFGRYLPPSPRYCGAAIVLDSMDKSDARRIAIPMSDRSFRGLID
jgi:hypothetical protein